MNKRTLLNNLQGNNMLSMNIKSEVDFDFQENEEGTSRRNMLMCFSCNFETDNIDELDEHILVSHGEDDDEIPEQKFQIVSEPFVITKKRKLSEITESFPKNIPRARIIVKKHESKFELCTDTKIVKDDGSKFSISGSNKKAKRAQADEMRCHLCSFITRKKSVLATHMLNHSDVIPPVYYKCSQCPYQTKRKNDMPKHMLGHCNNVRMYKCSECHYETKRKSDLSKHVICHLQPESVPLYKCKSCPYVTKRKGDLPKHEMNHVERSQVFSWNCTECEYFSKRKNDLHKHMLIHSDRQLTGVFKCLKCAYATDKVVKFSRHVLSKCACWDDPISLEHLMLEDILASVDKTGVHVVLDGGESEGEHEYVEEDVQYVEGNADDEVEYIEYAGPGENDNENSTVIIEGEVVDEQFVEGDSNDYVVKETEDEVHKD